MTAILGCPVEEVGDAAPPRSEEDMALLFVGRHSQDLRYVASWAVWMCFDGKRWQRDEKRLVFSHARHICRETAAQENGNRGKAIATAKTRAAVVSLASDDQRLAATVDQWDADPWILNTPSGAIDLKTGTSRKALIEDYITKVTAVAPGGHCPIWRQFLSTVTGGDSELQAYIQRLSGYALTGLTKEHALFFLYGTGANGKSVFVNTLAGLLGDYHRTAAIETFTATSSDRHPTELAMLRGARLVTSTETEEGRRWAESKIKAMTGGDKMTARFMRQDFFEFTPQFKLVIAGNHKPGLRSVDEAITRRFHLLPFEVTIPSEERDPELPEKLRLEWSGILAWAIEGCLAWQQHGLAPPQAVQDATSQYLDGEDTLGSWIDQACLVGRGLRDTSGNLFHSWSAFAEAAGEYVVSMKRFSQSLEAKGFVRYRGDDRGFEGLKVDPHPRF
jgi:putative DNA primase/helicase